MAEILAGRSGIDAVHVFTHGSPGRLHLGNTILTTESLASHAGAWTTVGNALTPGADLLIYGCNVAEGDIGLSFVNALGKWVGADIAASSDLSGSTGNWTLEVATGTIEAQAVMPDGYQGTLAAPTITGLDPYTFTEGGAASLIDSSVTFTGGSSYGGGYVEYRIAGSVAGDQLTLANGNGLTVSGSNVFSNGTFIGSIDSTFNGQNGQALRINFQSNFTNPGFEASSAGGGGVTGWTIGTERVILGQTAINGHRTPVDTTIPPNAGDDANGVQSMTYRSELSTTQKTEGSTSLRLYNSGQTNDGYDVVHGPYAYSNTFTSAANDVLYFDWRAAAGGDAFDVFAYLMKADGSQSVVVLNQTGANDTGETPWATSSVTVPSAGDWYFVFVAGTYDFTGGKAVGGSLYIDNFKVFGNTVNDTVASTLATQIAYQNTAQDAPSGPRTLTVTAVDGSQASSSATTTITVVGINNAPSFTAGAMLAAIDEDAIATGASVNSLFGPLYADPDTAYTPADTLAGIAVVADASDINHGAWQYSTDGGNNWHNVGAVSTTNALMLGASTLLRFQPTPDWNGTPGSLSVHAVDSTWGGGFTSGTARTVFNTTTVDSASSVSIASVTLGTSVTPVNDAPVLHNAGTSAPTLTTITENAGNDNGSPDSDGNPATLNDGDDDAIANTNNGGNLISDLVRAVDGTNDATGVTTKSFVSDVDFVSGGYTGGNPNEAHDHGIAIYGVNNAGPADGGKWQFSIDSGATWTDVNTGNLTGDFATASALLLRSTDKIRFVPDTFNGTTASISYVLWDGNGLVGNTPNQQGTYTNIATRGGSTNFSIGADVATISVTHLNDNPVLDLDGTTPSSVSTGFTTTFRPRGDAIAVVSSDISITDADKLDRTDAAQRDTISKAVVTLATGAVDNLYGTVWETLSFKSGGASGALVNSYAGSLGTISVSGNNSTQLTFTGEGTWADYQSVLKQVFYANGNPNAATGDRTITVMVTDSAKTVGGAVGDRLDSNVATTTVRIPWTTVVDLNGTDSGRDFAVTYTEDGPGVAIAASTASLDNQAVNLKTVTLTLSGGVDAAEKLFIDNSTTLSGLGMTMYAYLQSRGLTITGNDTHTLVIAATNTTTGVTAETMQLGLRAVKYMNTSQNPSVGSREVAVTVEDINNTGVGAKTAVTVIPVNDAPVRGGDLAGALDEGAVYVFSTADLNSTDVDNDAGTLKYVLTSAPAQGTLFRDNNNNGVVDAGEAIATVADSTSVAAINAIATSGYFTQAEVAAGTIKYAHNGQNPNGINPTGTDTFGFKVVDGMEDYPFANIAANQAGTVTLTITEVNDAPTGTVTVTGAAKEGQVLTAANNLADGDGPLSLVVSYQWQRYNGTTWTDIGGATGATYTLGASDAGQQVRAVGRYTDAAGRNESVASASVGTVVASNQASAGTVTVTGTPTVGSVLTADTSAVTDPDGLSPFSYQWEVYDTATSTWISIPGATQSTYTLGATDAGKQVRVAVSYTDGFGTNERVTSAGGPTVTVPAPAPNAAPYLTGQALALFGSVVASTVESGETIQALQLTVSGLRDGADEKLVIDGVMIDLQTTTTKPITGGTIGGVRYSITLNGGNPATATVTITHAGLTEAQTKALVEGLNYSNASASAHAGLRVVTLETLTDSGGSRGDIGLSATADVGDTLNAMPGSNTAPSVTGDLALTVDEGAVATLAAADLGGADTEQPGLSVVLESAPTHGKLFRDANGDGKLDAGEELPAGARFTLAELNAGRIKYAHDGSNTLTDSFGFHVSDGVTLSDADGGTAGQQAHTFNIAINAVNDAPTLTATSLGTSAATPVSFVEGSSAAALFAGTNADAGEATQNLTGITLMVSGLRDGSRETLWIDGQAIALTAGSGTTTANGVSYSVTLTGGTATVVLTKSDTGAHWSSLIDGIRYNNSSDNPTAGNRSVTLTSVTDADNARTTLAVTSHVNVAGDNNPPTFSGTGFTVLEGGSMTLTTSHIAAADVDTPLSSLTYTLSTAPAHGTVYIDANGNGVLDAGEALAANGSFTHSQLSAGQVRYLHDDGESNDSFGIVANDGQGGSSAPVTMNVTRTPVNDAPTITGLGSDVLSYPANSSGKTLEQGGDVLITDPDSAHFNGGNLRVSITFNRDPAHDLLTIANAGTGAGQIGITGSTVTYGGTSIGTFTGGSGTNDLVISFNTGATPTAVSALIKAIQFANDQAAPSSTSRTVSFALNDGGLGGQAAPVSVNVSIQSGVTPSISIANGFFVMENTQLVTALSATDPASRPITFSISSVADAVNNPDASKFEIVSGNLLRFKNAPDYEAPDDAGGNRVYNVIVRATNDQGSYAEQSLAVTVLDQNPEDAAVGDTAGPAFGFATVNGASLVMTYTDASPLATSNAPGAAAFAVKVGGASVAVTAVAINSAAKTVTLTLATPVTAGQAVTVSYTDPTAGDDVVALQDAAGNDAATLVDAAVSNVTPGAGGGGTPGGGTPGGNGSTTVTHPDGSTTTTMPVPGGGSIVTNTQPLPDGGTSTTKTTTGADGSTNLVTTVQPGTNGATSVPLASAGGNGGGAGDALLSATLPSGVGLTAEASFTDGMTLRQKLISASNPRITNDPAFREVVDEGIDQYVPGVRDQGQVLVRTITLTADPAQTGAAVGRIVINGAIGTGEDSTTHPLRQEALVIDARQLPPGTEVQLDNVEFAIVVGAVRLVGGSGRNFIVGDDAAQFMVLGEGDDVLRGGAGDDVIGSRGGNDRLYGDAGNDWVIGGIGNDHLEGGAGNDVLVGGASDAGAWTFSLGGDGLMHVSFTASKPVLTELPHASASGNWAGGEAPDARIAFVYEDYNQVQTISSLYQGLTGELPTLQAMNMFATLGWSQERLLQEAWNWYEGTLPAGASDAAKAQALISQTWGRAYATQDNVQAALAYLGQGGTFEEGLGLLVSQGPVRDAITQHGQMSLVKPATLSETGWLGEGGNDVLLGGAGNDVLIGGTGDDILDGGEGNDLASFVGTLQHFAVQLRASTASGAVAGDQELVLRHTLSGEEDILRNIEFVEIGGQAYRLVPSGMQQGVAYQPLSAHVESITPAELALVGLPPF